MPQVSCPSCGRPLEVDDAYRDWTVRCPHCATEFVPAEADPVPFEPAPRRRARYEDDEDDEYRPRRRRRRGRDPEEEAWERQQALALAHGPGTWLEVSGWLGGLLLGGIGVVCLAMAGARANGPGALDDELIARGAVSLVLALPYLVVLVVGGRKLRNLTSYNWAMTAAVVGLSSFLLLGCVCVCAFFPVGFGIWAVVALNNPLVVRQFARARDPRDWDD